MLLVLSLLLLSLGGGSLGLGFEFQAGGLGLGLDGLFEEVGGDDRYSRVDVDKGGGFGRFVRDYCVNRGSTAVRGVLVGSPPGKGKGV